MQAKTKKTFSEWWAGLLTPEAFLKMFVILCGLTLTTGYHLHQASDAIDESAAMDIMQNEEISDLDKAMTAQVLLSNTLTINQQNIKDDLNDIKQMIRDIQ